MPIGVVTAIAAPATLRVELSGDGGHAGAVLMDVRHDPLVAAAEVIQEVDRAARASGARDTVGTVGLLTLEPGAVNSIPRHVRMDIDIRDTDEARRDAVLDRVRAAARRAAEARGVRHADEILNADGPSTSDPAVLDAVEAACEEAGLPSVRMVSRAYHDCVFMARLCPTAMIFVPSAGGVSHRPDEYTSPAGDRPGNAGPGRRAAAAGRLSGPYWASRARSGRSSRASRRYTWWIVRSRGALQCRSSRMHRSSEPGTATSAAQRSGTVVSPASRAATAGNSAERSEVIVKMIEMRSSIVSSLRASTSASSSAVLSRIASEVSSATEVAPRTALTTEPVSAPAPPTRRGASTRRA